MRVLVTGYVGSHAALELAGYDSRAGDLRQSFRTLASAGKVAPQVRLGDMGMNAMRRVPAYIREYGVLDTAGRIFTGAVTRLFPHAFRRREIPTLGSLNDISAGVETSSARLLQQAGLATDDGISALAQEYGSVRKELAQRYERTRCLYPTAFAVEEESSALIYSLVRLLQPRTVVETGVANGHSTFLLLRALNLNGTGSLHSIDVSSDVGSLLSEDDKQSWHLHVLDPKALKRSLAAVFRAMGGVDLFIHDSDHSYQWMEFELESALHAWGRGATMCADDVHLTCAFIDFCSLHDLHPHILLDRRKAFGVVLGSQARG